VPRFQTTFHVDIIGHINLTFDQAENGYHVGKGFYSQQYRVSVHHFQASVTR